MKDTIAPGVVASTIPAKSAKTSAPVGTFQDLKPYRDALERPPVHDLTHEPDEVTRTVHLTQAQHSYAPTQLQATTAWTYDGTVPGPTFVTRKGQTVRIQWRNGISESCTLPYRVIRANDDNDLKVPPQNFPGEQHSTIDPGGDPMTGAAHDLTAATVTHLHGARVAADSDGWTENVAQHGRAQHATYHDRPRSATLWYHDHAIGVTRLNVYAGLFGFWLIRDAIETDLIHRGLLPGGKDEVALVIQDRNLDIGPSGSLNGDLLHKSETSTAEMFGPYTIVNGTIWPKLEVQPGPVRLRLLNGSNARTFCLKLVRATATADESADGGFTYADDLGDSVTAWQVGTDGGLLDRPVRPSSVIAYPPDLTPPPPSAEVDRGLIMAPAERVDLVVDFSKLKPGDSVAFVNTAFAPFHGSTITSPYTYQQDGTLAIEPGAAGAVDAGRANQAVRLTHAHVLLFEVKDRSPDRPGGHHPSTLTASTPLNPDFRRFVHRAGESGGRAEELIPEGHTHRWIALTENPPGSLFFRELREIPATGGMAPWVPDGFPVISIIDDKKTRRWFRTAAMRFHDTVGIIIASGSWEVWNLINLTVDTHPIHVHLVEFQVLDRIPVDTSSYIAECGSTRPGKPIDVSNASALPPRLLDPNEQGYKDTVRVNPGELVKIAARFDGYCGRYMYHCHILEHEDMDMMRPFVVVTPQAMKAMQADGMDVGGMGGMPM